MDPVAIPVARPDPRHVDVVLEAGLVIDVDPLLGAVLVEQAQLDAVAVLREQREVRAGAVPGGPLGERPAWAQRAEIDHRWTAPVRGTPSTRPAGECFYPA